MADLSKIKLNGVEYDLKDSFAREELDNKQIKNFVLKYKFTNSYFLLFLAASEPGSSYDLPDENCENINEFFQALNINTFNLDQDLQTRIEVYDDNENLISYLIFNLTILSRTSRPVLIGSNNYQNKTYILSLSPDNSGKLNGQIEVTSLENITIYNASVNDNNIISISGHTTGDIWNEVSDDMDNMYVRNDAYGKYFLKLNIESEDINLPLIGQGLDNNGNGYYAIFSGTRNNKIYTARVYQNNNFGELVINETPSSAQITYWNQKSDFSGSYNDLTNKPTSVSEFVNDVGYLTSYTETDPTVPAWAKQSTKPTYTANEVGALPDTTVIPTVPTNVSAFNNDAGYLTSYTETDPIFTASAAAGISSTDITNWNAKSDFSGLYNDLENKPVIPTDISDLTDESRIIPTIPETVSSFQNDAGYLTSFTETYPTVPSWAKAVSKPTYTASEVGALPDSTTYVSSFNGSTGAISYTAPVVSVNGTTGVVVVDKLKTTAMETNTEYNLIGTASSNNNTSAVNVYQQTPLSFAKTNSLSRLTIGSTSLPGIIRLYTDASGASGYSEIKSNASSTNERTITLPDASGTVALTTDIPSISSWALASSKPSYTFSELTSHPTSLEGYGITDAYTKTEVDGLVSGVLHYKGTKATVSALPSSGNAVGDVWHVTANAGEYAWDGSTWQELGSNVDLSGYVPTSRTVNGKALTGNISLTASDVSALPSSTTYVSSFNGQKGAITYTAPVTSVNGQTGAVTLSIPAAVSVTNTLTSGTLIATINGTNIYAPSYTDADGVGY